MGEGEVESLIKRESRGLAVKGELHGLSISSIIEGAVFDIHWLVKCQAL